MPLASGFGVETALSIDLGRKGFRIVEVPIDVRHRATGTDLRGQLHRGRQFLHVARALAARSGVLHASVAAQQPAGRTMRRPATTAATAIRAATAAARSPAT